MYMYLYIRIYVPHDTASFAHPYILLSFYIVYPRMLYIAQSLSLSISPSIYACVRTFDILWLRYFQTTRTCSGGDIWTDCTVRRRLLGCCSRLVVRCSELFFRLIQLLASVRMETVMLLRKQATSCRTRGITPYCICFICEIIPPFMRITAVCSVSSLRTWFWDGLRALVGGDSWCTCMYVLGGIKQRRQN